MKRLTKHVITGAASMLLGIGFAIASAAFSGCGYLHRVGCSPGPFNGWWGAGVAEFAAEMLAILFGFAIPLVTAFNYAEGGR